MIMVMLTNMAIRWHHFHWHIHVAWDCKKLSQNPHKKYIVFVDCHLLVTVWRVVTIAETFLTPSCFSPRSNSCVFSSLVVRLSWQWGGSKVENCLEIYPDNFQGRPEGETGAFKWEDRGRGEVGIEHYLGTDVVPFTLLSINRRTLRQWEGTQSCLVLPPLNVLKF